MKFAAVTTLLASIAAAAPLGGSGGLGGFTNGLGDVTNLPEGLLKAVTDAEHKAAGLKGATGVLNGAGLKNRDLGNLAGNLNSDEVIKSLKAIAENASALKALHGRDLGGLGGLGGLTGDGAGAGDATQTVNGLLAALSQAAALDDVAGGKSGALPGGI